MQTEKKDIKSFTLEELIETYTNDNLIVLGDFNTEKLL